MMSFSSFADEEGGKKSKSKEEMKKRLSKCKFCNWSSPKFYQLIMNDIPLIICQVMAYLYGLLDPLNAIVGIFLTLCDLICMLFYLSYDDEVSIDADAIFVKSVKRIDECDQDNQRIFDENYNFTSAQDSVSEPSDEGDEIGEQELMLTENH